MTSTWTLSKKVASGFALGLILLVIIGAIAYHNMDRMSQTNQQVARSYQIIQTTDDLLSTLKDIETGMRGYVLTGTDTFLQPYQTGNALIWPIFKQLRNETEGSAKQQQRLDRVQELLTVITREHAEVVRLRQKSGFDAARARVASQRGKQTMDALRSVLGELAATEQNLLALRAQEAQSAVTTTRYTIVLGTLIAMIFKLLAGIWITRSATRQIGTSVESLKTSSFELQAVANQQAAGSGQQATSMSEIAATMRELIETARQITAGAQQVGQVANETAAAARSGEQAVERAQDALTTIRGQVDAIVAHMLELGKKSQQIGMVLDITRELADQTNIVAINATIEAMGAGEAGRRFAAIADEIRKLADRVAHSTKEIRPLIDEIRTSASTTMMATEGGAKAVEAGTRQFLELAAAFSQIVGQVGMTAEAVREIELMTQQQTSAVEQVNLAIADTARAAREAEAGSQQTLQTATHLSELSRELSLLVEANRVVRA